MTFATSVEIGMRRTHERSDAGNEGRRTARAVPDDDLPVGETPRTARSARRHLIVMPGWMPGRSRGAPLGSTPPTVSTPWDVAGAPT